MTRFSLVALLVLVPACGASPSPASTPDQAPTDFEPVPHPPVDGLDAPPALPMHPVTPGVVTLDDAGVAAADAEPDAAAPLPVQDAAPDMVAPPPPDAGRPVQDAAPAHDAAPDAAPIPTVRCGLLPNETPVYSVVCSPTAPGVYSDPRIAKMEWKVRATDPYMSTCPSSCVYGNGCRVTWKDGTWSAGTCL